MEWNSALGGTFGPPTYYFITRSGAWTLSPASTRRLSSRSDSSAGCTHTRQNCHESSSDPARTQPLHRYPPLPRQLPVSYKRPCQPQLPHPHRHQPTPPVGGLRAVGSHACPAQDGFEEPEPVLDAKAQLVQPPQLQQVLGQSVSYPYQPQWLRGASRPGQALHLYPHQRDRSGGCPLSVQALPHVHLHLPVSGIFGCSTSIGLSVGALIAQSQYLSVLPGRSTSTVRWWLAIEASSGGEPDQQIALQPLCRVRMLACLCQLNGIVAGIGCHHGSGRPSLPQLERLPKLGYPELCGCAGGGGSPRHIQGQYPGALRERYLYQPLILPRRQYPGLRHAWGDHMPPGALRAGVSGGSWPGGTVERPHRACRWGQMHDRKPAALIGVDAAVGECIAGAGPATAEHRLQAQMHQGSRS